MDSFAPNEAQNEYGPTRESIWAIEKGSIEVPADHGSWAKIQRSRAGQRLRSVILLGTETRVYSELRKAARG